jgi:hypothetical protein
MSRIIALLGLAQASAVISGFFGLGIILRHHGYPNEPFQFGSSFGVYHWSPLALFLRRFSLIFLLLPLTWTISAAILENRARFILPFELWLIVGTIIPFTIIMTFFYAILHPCVYVVTN